MEQLLPFSYEFVPMPRKVVHELRAGSTSTVEGAELPSCLRSMTTTSSSGTPSWTARKNAAFVIDGVVITTGIPLCSGESSEYSCVAWCESSSAKRLMARIRAAQHGPLAQPDGVIAHDAILESSFPG
jgi:hypothetical protein